MEKRTVGVLGDGQLGRMMGEAAHRLGVRLIPLGPGGDQSPAGQVCHGALKGSFRDREMVRELSKQCDVLTVEIEHVDASAHEELEAEGHVVQPSAKTLKIIQDKYVQKEHMSKQEGVALGPYKKVTCAKDVEELGLDWGWPVMLKSRLMVRIRARECFWDPHAVDCCCPYTSPMLSLYTRLCKTIVGL